MCECDDRGTQLDYDDGNWCYLKEAPCELHTGDVVGDNGDNGDPWARCQVNGDFQVECPTNMPEGNNSSSQKLDMVILDLTLYISIINKIGKTVFLSILSKKGMPVMKENVGV